MFFLQPSQPHSAIAIEGYNFLRWGKSFRSVVTVNLFEVQSTPHDARKARPDRL